MISCKLYKLIAICGVVLSGLGSPCLLSGIGRNSNKMATGLESHTGENASGIREGFICPICMEDFVKDDKLLLHFEEAHDTEEDKDVLQAFKDFLGKAKKILKSDNPFEILEKAHSKPSSQKKQEHIEWDPQDFGVIRSHWSDFRKFRSNRMDFYAAETNKLIIRLDKIVSCLPSEATKRREHEQSVVTWVNDEDVQLCPQCAKSFNILRRKHHCRVCGTVQCHQCSQFLLLSFARKLTNPSYVPALDDGKDKIPNPPKRLTHAAFNALKRTGSTTSLTSLIDTDTGEGHIRVCFYCKQLLERRELQMDSRSQNTVIAELYTELRKYMEKGMELMPVFLKMLESFSQGESTYNLKDAQDCRLKLLKIAEYVDGYSKKIQSLGIDDEKNPTTGTALSLQLKIRLSAVNFLKENLLGLPNLPTDEQLMTLQAERRQAIENRIAREKKAVFEKRETETRRHADGHRDFEAVSVDRGWGVETTNIRNVNESDDPMLQQMEIMQNYIQQARRANRYDDVVILEANLRDLRVEHERLRSQPS